MNTNFYKTTFSLISVYLLSLFSPISSLVAQGCQGLGGIPLNVLPKPVPTIDAPVRICPNSTATLTVPEAFSTYEWSTGSANQSITISGPGTYGVTVTNSGGCLGTATVQVLPFDSPVPVISGAPDTCNGQILLSIQPGFSSVMWSNGSAANAINVSVSNNYSVTVTNTSGCTGTQTYTANILPLPQVSISGVTSFCNSDSIHLIAISNDTTSYLWSTGQNTSSIVVTSSGAYAVTLTNQYGCTASDTLQVNDLGAPQPSINGPAVICDSTSTTLGVANSYSSYLWNFGADTNSVVVNSPGVYTVTVTDVNGCTGTSSHVLLGSSTPDPAINQAPYNCDGILVLQAVPGFSSYLWSNGETGASTTVNTSGVFTVSVSNAEGCLGFDTLIATVPMLPSVEILGLDSICPGTNTMLSVANTFAQYIWSNGTSDFELNVGASGAYAVTVTDGFGCTASDEFQLNNYLVPVAQIDGVSQICTVGTATFSVAGNFAAYEWNTGETSSSITTNIAGTYTVTVTTSNACSATATHSLTIGTNLQPLISDLPYACDGQVSLDVGTGYSTYIWSNGQSTQGITVAAGSYTVTVADGNGCTGSATILANVPPDPFVDISGNAAFCSGDAVDLTLGQSFAQYAWSTGATTQNITIGAGNTYTVTITDILGCTATDQIIIQENPLPSPSANILPYLCDEQLTIQASPGFLLYQWVGPNGFVATGQQAIASSSGSYSVVVTDANGCTGSASIPANIPVETVVSLSGPTQICMGATASIAALPGFTAYAWNDGSIQGTLSVSTAGTYSVTATDALGCTSTASTTLGFFQQQTPVIAGPTAVCPDDVATLNVVGPYQAYQWNTGETGASIMPPPPFSASVTVTDSNGCTGTASATLGVLDPPQPVLSSLPYSCNNQITLDAAPGFGYEWSGPNGFSSNLQQPNALASGTYLLTVTDANGCTGTGTISVSIPVLPGLSVTGTSLICPGSTTDLMASSGFVAYQWSNGTNTPGVAIHQAGTYTVTATDQYGCTVSASFMVNLANTPSPNIAQQPYDCNHQLTLDAGADFIGYLWNNGGILQTLDILQSGTYSVTVTNTLGCTGTASLQVSIPADPVVQIAGANSLCTGSSTMLNALGSGLQYVWSTGASVPSILVSQSGTYAVTATDAFGCTVTETHLIHPVFPVTNTTNLTTCRLEQAGVQSMTFTGSNGCDSVHTTVTTYQPNRPEMMLDVVSEMEAIIGQQIQISVGANFTIDSIAYHSPFTLSCFNCQNPTMMAITPGFIQIEAFDPDGCLATDEIRVIINRDIRIYVPNVFNPESSENGYFSVFSGTEIESVQNFNVFDRWGNQLFHRANLPTNSPSSGWDGTFRNQRMQPGVFVYYFEVLLADGSVVQYSGDITLMD